VADTFKPGEVVDITIKGVRVHQLDDHGCVSILADSHHPDAHHGAIQDSFQMPPQAAVTRVAPAEWPPQVGDLWRDQFGDLWFAYQGYGPDGETYVGLRCAIDKVTEAWGDQIVHSVNQEYGPLTLVHREDQQDGGDRG
jgi:hypothetical protein